MYTYFNKKKKVLCVIQVIDTSASDKAFETVMPHNSVGHVSKHDDGTGDFVDSWI